MIDKVGRLMARPGLFRINLRLLNVALRGLGVLNFGSLDQTGERWFLKRVANSCDASAAIFDIGANTGDFVCLIDEFFCDADIYAFEPNKSALEKLERISLKKNRVKVIPKGCGSFDEETVLFVPAQDGSSRHSSVNRMVLESALQRGEILDIEEQEISVVTLDEFTLRSKIHEIYFLKIDVEGNELEVLRGATRLLQEGAIEIIQFEFNEMNAFNGSFLWKFFDLMNGYRFYRLLPKGLLDLAEYRPITHELFGYQNIVAIREGSAFLRK